MATTCQGEWDHGEWSNWCGLPVDHDGPHLESGETTSVLWWDRPFEVRWINNA